MLKDSQYWTRNTQKLRGFAITVAEDDEKRTRFDEDAMFLEPSFSRHKNNLHFHGFIEIGSKNCFHPDLGMWSGSKTWHCFNRIRAKITLESRFCPTTKRHCIEKAIYSLKWLGHFDTIFSLDSQHFEALLANFWRQEFVNRMLLNVHFIIKHNYMTSLSFQTSI